MAHQHRLMDVLRRLGVAVSCWVLSSCTPTQSAIVADGDQKARAIVKRTRENVARITAAWKKERAYLDEELEANLFFPVCDDNVPPTSQCGMIAERYLLAHFVASFEQTHCVEPELAGDKELCRMRLMALALDEMDARYRIRVRVAPGATLHDVELAAMARHNEAAFKRHASIRAELDRKYRARLESLLKNHTAQLRKNEEEVHQRLEAVERARSVALALGHAMQAYAQTMAAPSDSTSMVQAFVPACTSDYQCGAGRVCVKDSGSYHGRCAKVVNAHGVPEYQPARLESLGPGQGQCVWDTECPVGFRCVRLQAASVRGNCLR